MAAPTSIPAIRRWSFRTAWPLLVAALLFTLVWALPLVLGYFGMIDPGLVYRTSPAEHSSTPWAQQTAADANTISAFARIMGGGVVAIALVGLLFAWWPMVIGRRYAIMGSIIASGIVLAVAAYFHVNGYWNVWPLGAVVAAWVLGAIASVSWLVMHRADRATRERTRRRAGAS